jgi:hypothetical protein
MNRAHLTALGLACCMAAALAQADDAGLLRCRALVDAGARLACYDALPAGTAAAAGAPKPAAAATAPAPAPVPASVAPAAAVVSSPQGAFGLPPSALPGGEVKFIDSQINGRFEGWGPGQLIELANGQVWRIADGSRATFETTNPKVRIEAGAFSAFYMVVDGTNQAPRVRRVK